MTKNLIGSSFGRLLVVQKRKINLQGNSTWLCKCSCGNTIVVSESNLKDGKIKSCGCWLKYPDVSDQFAKINTRRNNKKFYDTRWTAEMSSTIRKLFPMCVVCGMSEQEHQLKYGTTLHIDHVNPLSKGHGLKPGNAVILCRACNTTKHAKNIKQLPITTRKKILTAAQQFDIYWEYLNTYNKQ